MHILTLSCITLCISALASSQIVFPGQIPRQDPKDEKLLNILNLNVPRRIRRNNHGRVCTDPNGVQGTCSYITDSNCDIYSSKIIPNGRRFRRNLARFLRKSTRRPCGYDGFDFTICCPSQVSTTTSKPPPPNLTNILPKDCGRQGQNNEFIPRFKRQIEDLKDLDDGFGVIPKLSAPAVVGGFESVVGNWPWAVALGQPKGVHGFSSVCGGSLITNQHVLTAAHCVPNNPNPEQEITHARIGDHDINSLSDQANPRTARICQVIRHEGFTISRSVENDMAILKLCDQVEFGPFIQPVCLPKRRDQVFNSDLLTVIGWGAEQTGGKPVDRLRQADVVHVPLNKCQEDYATRRVNLNQRHLCAGIGNTDACAGDSGGPLLKLNEESDRWTIMGVTSFGIGCASDQFPGVYSNVPKFLDWIMENLS